MYNMQSEKSTFPRIFYHSSIEWKDDIEEVTPFKLSTPGGAHNFLICLLNTGQSCKVSWKCQEEQVMVWDFLKKA